MQRFASIDEYIESFSGQTKDRLMEMRQIVRELLPDAQERISYNMPSYLVDAKIIVYFAGFKDHIGMYPGKTQNDAYNDLAAQYASGKSTARFPNNEPLPKNIIAAYIQVRLAELGLSV